MWKKIILFFLLLSIYNAYNEQCMIIDLNKDKQENFSYHTDTKTYLLRYTIEGLN